MCAALVGDIRWLKQSFGGSESEGMLRLRCLNGEEKGLNEIVSASEFVVVVTDQVPHAVRRRVVEAAMRGNVPVCMRHSCGATAIGSHLRKVSGQV